MLEVVERTGTEPELPLALAFSIAAPASIAAAALAAVEFWRPLGPVAPQL